MIERKGERLVDETLPFLVTYERVPLQNRARSLERSTRFWAMRQGSGGESLLRPFASLNW